MAAATSLSTFGGTATPPTNFATPTGKSDMDEAAGVASPTTYAADCAMVYTGATYVNGRFQIQIKNEFKSPVTLLYKLANQTDLTADHGEIVFTPGSSVAPAWNVPDTITFKKRVSGTTSTITPTNTADGNPLNHPSIVGTTVSLRHRRIAADDIIEVRPFNDYVVVCLNHLPVALESVTGLPSSTEYVGLISHSGSATTQAYDNARGGALVTRYVNGATGNDTTGDGTSGNPWATIGKGIAAQAAGEACFVAGGSYAQSIQCYTGGSSGTPRTATSFEDPVMWAAVPDSTVTNTAGHPFITTGSVAYLVAYGITYRCNGGTDNYAFRSYQGGYPLMAIGCRFERANKSGLQLAAQGFPATGWVGGNTVMDCSFLGNGWKAGGLDHQLYAETGDNEFLYNTLNGATAGSGACLGYGFHVFFSTSGATYTSNTIIRGNLVTGHLGSGRAGILASRGTNLRVLNNRAYNNSVGINLGLVAVNGIVANNLVYDNDTGILLGGTSATNCASYNNTIVDNTTYGLRNHSTASGSLSTNDLFYNNGTNVQADAAITQTTNYAASASTEFQDYANNNFQLSGTGSGATGGTDLSATIDAADYFGYARPQGATWSRGAFEIPDPATNPLVSMDNVSGNVNTEIALVLSILGQGNEGVRMRMTRSSTDITVNAPASGSVTVKGGN